ncbi:GYD domain-containing protein [Nitratireductor sp. XY-223]|uniref:GYD domain-containing protein n=1 Tax=Nitratireductor sp. XY-223 TaxID=2561926 RepID=UPI00145BDEBF|nr:GYD domain-containing protein [Nitratireductor sp. XY-223]
MPIYIQTGRMSEQTLQGLIENPEDRFQAVSDVLAEAGATLKDYYFTSGETDWLMIIEADSLEAVAAAAMVAGGSGAAASVSTRQAWTSAEFKAVAAKAGQIAGKYRKPG